MKEPTEDPVENVPEQSNVEENLQIVANKTEENDKVGQINESCDRANSGDCSDVEKTVSSSTDTDTGYSNVNETSSSKYTEALDKARINNVDNVIDENLSVQLVNNQINVLANDKTNQPNNEHSHTEEERKTILSNVLESNEEVDINKESAVIDHDETKQVVNENESLENTCVNTPANVETNTDSSLDLAANNKEQCSSSVEKVNIPAKAINEQNDSDSTTCTDQVKTEVVTNVCEVISKTVAKEILDQILEKVIDSHEHVKPEDKAESFGEPKEEAGKEEEKDEKEYFSSKSSQRSEDDDEVEKSDGSDSGIGSELIDEVITKSSSDSSSTTSSDEFATGNGEQEVTSAESWVTPCISFSEMSDIDFSGTPRLSMPTFDDLTRSPCDVFATEGNKLDYVRGEKKDFSDNGTDQSGEPEDTAEPQWKSSSIQETNGRTNLTSPEVSKDHDSDEDIDISSIDDDEVKPEVPYISSSLLQEIPSIPSTSRQTSFKSNLKRPHQNVAYESELPPAKKKKGITFDTVSVYYFPRMQGFTCVPSQGGSTLGMSWHHSHVQTFTLSQYALEQRRVHQRMARSPHCSVESAGSISGCDSNDDSDSDEQFSDQDFDSDSSYTLQPVKIRQRRAMLRAAGVDKIDPTEKNQCKQIRISREFCGCACEGYCDPEICACALAGIKCQVDRQNFPCGCSRDCCANPKGRIEFNPVRVHSHYIQTIMRMKAQKKDDDDMSRLYDYQQFHNYHPAADYEPATSTLSSYYPHHHPQYLSSHHHHHHHHSELLSNFELQQQMHSCYEPFNPELALYNNLSSAHEKIGDSFTELLPSAYSGETFASQTTGDLYTESNLTSGYRAYSGGESSDQFSDYTRDTPAPDLGTMYGTYASSCPNATQTQSYSATTGPTPALGVSVAPSPPITGTVVSETENFGEIIKKTMVESVIA